MSTNPFLAMAGMDAPPDSQRASPTGVPRSVRNNNPGNIIFDPNNNWQGQTGSDGKFAMFDTPENGDRAHAKLLENYQKLHGINTVRDAITRFAPPKDGNDTNAYIASVTQKLGVGPNDPIDLSDPSTNAALRNIQQPIEAGQSQGQPAQPQPDFAADPNAKNAFLDMAQGDEAGWHRGPDGRLVIDITPNDAPSAKETDQKLGFYQGLMRPIDNAAHWVDKGAKSIGLNTDALSRALGLPTTDEANAGHQNYIKSQEWKGTTPGKTGDALGSVVGTLPLALATANPFALGAAGGALNTMHPDSVGETAKGAAIGAVTGKLGDMAVGGVTNTIFPKVSNEVRMLADRGVPLTPGQIIGGSAKRVEDAATSVPFAGDMVRNAQIRSIEGGNRAALNEALSPIGEQLPGHVAVGRDAAAHAQAVSSAAYDKSLGAMKIAPDPKFSHDLSLAQAAGSNLPPTQAASFNTIMTRDVAPFMKGSTMSGEQLQAIKRGLDKRIASFQKTSASPADELTLEPLQQVHDAIMSAAERQNPKLFGDYENANAAYSRVQRINDATAKMRADKEFTPNAFAQAVAKRGYGTTTAKVAAGDASMQKLADAMMKVLPSSVPDSGTPLRSLIIGGSALGVASKAGLMSAALLKGLPAALPLAAYTKLGQKAVSAAILKRPSGAKEIAEVLAKLKGPAALGASQLAVSRVDAAQRRAKLEALALINGGETSVPGSEPR